MSLTAALSTGPAVLMVLWGHGVSVNLSHASPTQHRAHSSLLTWHLHKAGCWTEVFDAGSSRPGMSGEQSWAGGVQW